MDATRPSYPIKLLSLQETARRLAVSVDTLLSWNEHDILTPKITKDGTIGYAEEQIVFFQSIQKSLIRQLPSQPLSLSQESLVNKPTVNSPKNAALPERPHTFPRLFMALTLFGAAGGILMLTQGSQFASILNQFAQYQNQTANQAKALGSQTSTLQFTPFNTFSTSVDLQTDDTRSKKLNNAGKNTTFVLFQQQKTNRTNSSTPTSRVLAARTSQPQKTSETTKNTPSQMEKLATDLKSNDASTLSPIGNTQASGLNLDLGTLNTSNNIKNDTVTTTAAVGILGIMLFVLQSQLAVFGKRPQKISFQPVANTHPVEKLLELEQKMDGTVVAVFQGKEYKICKPELYSDSDQFIERLMELTSMEEKEIEYDSFTDARLRLSTPLSRIVTRLNFVGLKRDLFFPRTSKNRVLFRRFITYQDLLTMNLTVSDVVSDLTKVA